jgi:RloB-like protein
VEVKPSQLGTSPKQIVQYAKELFLNGDRHKNIRSGAFEKVFVVFDRDDHEGYYEALAMVASLDGKLKNDNKQVITFRAIPSIPCFELWLLLHFDEVNTPLHRDEVIQRLKRYISGYEKGAFGMFKHTRANLADAMRRAELLAKKFNAYTEPESFTAVLELVDLLVNIRG